jgi:hypothetical protein
VTSTKVIHFSNISYNTEFQASVLRAARVDYTSKSLYGQRVGITDRQYGIKSSRLLRQDTGNKFHVNPLL